MPRRDQAWVSATMEELKSAAASLAADWYSVTDTTASRMDDCPAHALGGPFPGWSSVFAARQVALAAIRTGVLDARDAIRAAFDELLSDAEPGKVTFQRVQDWLVDLSKIARLDVADEALRWLVAWRSIGPVVTSGNDMVERGAVQHRVTKHVTLRASADVLTRTPQSTDYTVYVSTGAPASEVDDLGIAARVSTILWLAGRSVDTAVVLHPKSREVRRFDVTRSLVELGAAQYVAAVRTVARKASGTEEPAHLPGPQCRWCDLRAHCAEGQHYLATNPEVSGGLPIRLPAQSD